MEKNEEWNNFMHRVTEISGIISGLTCTDREQSNKAHVLADKYLVKGAQTIVDFDENIEMQIVNDRTVINEKACHKREKATNKNEMDPEMFMKEMGRDADQRAADKKIRLEKADTLKTRAMRAFRRGDFETALSCYNKAVDNIKDSCLLYTNRALTNLKLRNFEKVLYDCEWALKCNKNSFKAQLYRVKAHQGLRNTAEYGELYRELIASHHKHKELIDNFLKEDFTDDENEEDIS